MELNSSQFKFQGRNDEQINFGHFKSKNSIRVFVVFVWRNSYVDLFIVDIVNCSF